MYLLKQVPEDFIVEEIPSFKDIPGGKYTYFRLEKKEYNSEKAVQIISKAVNVPRSRFSYAGNKDKNALTSQYVSVFSSNIVDGEFSGGNIKIKVVGRGDEPISLGMHSGNRFTITARKISNDPKLKYFTINYFDEQRFSSKNLRIGTHILKDEMRLAAELMDEHSIKAHLEKASHDYVGALKTIPKKTLSLYLHSVQSYIWNEAASAYLRMHSKDIKEEKYSEGIFIFTDTMPDEISHPLIAFDTEFNDPEIEKIYEDILERLGLSQRDFIIRKMPEMSLMGAERPLVSKIHEPKLLELSEDELNPGSRKAILSFILDRGSYATIAIRDMFL